MSNVLTQEEINLLIDSPQFRQTFTKRVEEENCPNCKTQTKKVVIKQRIKEPTFIQILDENNMQVYKGEVHKYTRFCFGCRTLYSVEPENK
jgi:hypothetical protein